MKISKIFQFVLSPNAKIRPKTTTGSSPSIFKKKVQKKSNPDPFPVLTKLGSSS
jgi:hypothetical protein